MGFLNRVSSGWELGKQSLLVIGRDKTLLLFPLLSGICSLAVVGLFFVGVGPEEFESLLQTVEEGTTQEEVSPISYIAAFLLYFGLYFITIFFNVALVGCARNSLRGRDTTVAEGLGVALRHLHSILMWSVVSATVGLLLNLIESEERVGNIIRSILGTVWSVLTYFVVPVMVFERVGVFSSIGRSAKIMKRTWGENLVAQFSLGALFFLLTVPIVALAIVAVYMEPALVVPLMVGTLVYIVLLALLSTTASSILTVALYLYAAGDRSLEGFEAYQLRSAFDRR